MIPRAMSVWGLRRMDPAFREQIMLTVTNTNGCRYCSYVHQEWAIRTGVSDEEIAQLEGCDPAHFDRVRWSALVYARSLAENDFQDVPAEIIDDVTQHFSRSEIRDIETVALVMSIANRSTSTMEALGSRLRGGTGSESVAAEIAITAGIVAISPLLIPALSLVLRKSPVRLLRDIRALAAAAPADDTRAA